MFGFLLRFDLNTDGNSFVQHNADTSISQEFYIWPSVTQAAKNALDIRFVIFSPPRCGSATSSIHDALLVLSFGFYFMIFAFSFFIYSIRVLY